MAILGEEKWENLALMFTGKGFRNVTIEYFQPAELAEARGSLSAKD